MSCKSEATHVIHLLDLQYLLKSFPNFQDIIFNRNFRSQLIDYKHKYSPLDSNKTLFSSLRHAKKPNPFHIHYTQLNALNKNTKNSKKKSQILSAGLFTIIFIRVSNSGDSQKGKIAVNCSPKKLYNNRSSLIETRKGKSK